MSQYNKAIVAFLGSLVTLLAAFGIDLPWATPEMVSAVGGVVTTFLVWLVPNKQPTSAQS